MIITSLIMILSFVCALLPRYIERDAGRIERLKNNSLNVKLSC